MMKLCFCNYMYIEDIYEYGWFFVSLVCYFSLIVAGVNLLFKYNEPVLSK